MPEYIRKVRLEYEEKLMSPRNNQNRFAELEKELKEAEVKTAQIVKYQSLIILEIISYLIIVNDLLG